MSIAFNSYDDSIANPITFKQFAVKVATGHPVLETARRRLLYILLLLVQLPAPDLERLPLGVPGF
jgi:hypothetical protein